MDLTEDRYWPFHVLPLEQRTELYNQEIAFLESAYGAGHKPYVFGLENFGATSEDRAGEIIYRDYGGKLWEVFLTDSGRLRIAAYVDGFVSASEALLSWLRGVEESEIVEILRPHLVSKASSPSDIRIVR